MPRNIEDKFQLNINAADLPDNKEDFQLIWLDASLDQSSDRLTTQKMLRTINTNAQFYTDVEKCLRLIQNISAEHILLIVSGQLAHQILPQVSSLRAVRAVFIFCETRELHTALLLRNSYKIVDIYTDQDALFQSISETIKLIEKQDEVFHLFDRTQKSTRDLSRESASFLWHRLLIDVLKRLPADEQAKNEMLDHCAAYYRHNKTELKNIERFRTSYTPAHAIKYYTEDSFLYRLLNKALRTEDIGLLYTFRFFIIDLCVQLEDGKKLLAESESLTLYRGQQMPKEEFEHLKTKIGSLIATNGFLSTSCEECVSSEFSCRSLLGKDMIQVSLTIKADPKLKTVIFADISRQSEFKFEKEVLFSLGAVFRIDAYDFDDVLSIGKLTLTATDEGSDILKEFLEAQKTQLEVYSPMIYFGRLLMIGSTDIDRAEIYFRALLKTLPNNHPDIAEVYNQIGIMRCLRHKKEEALELFEKALEIRRNTFGEKDIRIAYSMNNIGSVHNEWKEYDRAFDCYQRALQIIDSAQLGDGIFKAVLIQNCGILKHRTDDREAALSYYTAADEMYSRYLLMHHPTSLRSATTIAEFYEEESDFINALKYYKRAYESCEVMHQPLESIFKKAYEGVVRCCLKLNNENLATIYLDRVLRTCEKLSLNVKEASNYYVLSMAKLSEDGLHFDLALRYYKEYLRLNPEETSIPYFEHYYSYDFPRKSSMKRDRLLSFKIDAYEKLFTNNDLQHFSFLFDMGKLLERNNVIDSAYQCYQKAFDVLEGLILSDKHIFQNGTIGSYEDIYTLFNKIFSICVANGEEQVIHNYIERATNIYQKDPVSLSRCYRYLGDLYWTKTKIEAALQYYKQFLLITEIKESSATKALDEVWTNFVLEIIENVDSLIDVLPKLFDIHKLCNRHLPSHHFKTAAVLWTIGYWYEEQEMYDEALRNYRDAMTIWEQFLYNCDDERTKNSLRSLIYRDISNSNCFNLIDWLKGPGYSNFGGSLIFDNADALRKCIFQRLKIWKMVCIDDLWQFHLKLTYCVLKSELCSIIEQPMLRVCIDQLYSTENNISSGIHKIICCLEFISHCYFARNQYSESLLHRQHQLELERKLLPSNHPYVGWSLWFIGLIFGKMDDHHLSLDYFNQAFRTFQHSCAREHIRELEEHISLANRILNEEINLQTVKNKDITMQKMETKQLKLDRYQCAPRFLQVYLHLD